MAKSRKTFQTQKREHSPAPLTLPQLKLALERIATSAQIARIEEIYALNEDLFHLGLPGIVELFAAGSTALDAKSGYYDAVGDLEQLEMASRVLRAEEVMRADKELRALRNMLLLALANDLPPKIKSLYELTEKDLTEKELEEVYDEIDSKTRELEVLKELIDGLTAMIVSLETKYFDLKRLEAGETPLSPQDTWPSFDDSTPAQVKRDQKRIAGQLNRLRKLFGPDTDGSPTR